MRKAGHRARWGPAAALLLAGVVLAAAPVAAAGKDVELGYRTGALAAQVITPAKALTGGKPFLIQKDRGTIDIAGRAVQFGVRWVAAANGFYIALDTNGNDQLDVREWVKLPASLSASFLIKTADFEYAVHLANVGITARTTGISSVRGGYMVYGCMQGSHEGTMIRLFDDNLDGQYTQDGQDAIAIGRGAAAIPLLKVHQIGSQHCELEVASDGQKVGLTPMAGVELGVVEVPYKRGLGVLSFTSSDGKSYDLAVSGRGGIPAGSYNLRFGALSAGGQLAVIKPTKSTPTYDIQAGKINTLRLGPPVRVSFAANYGNRTVTVSPSVSVVGAGGELYSFDYSGGTGRPHVLLLEDTRLLQDIPMAYG